MTKLSAKTAITPTIVEANKGSLHLHLYKEGSPNVSYNATDNDIMTQVFADAAARAAAVPGFIGQFGYQIDTKSIYVSNGITAGSWSLLAGSARYTPTYSNQSGINVDYVYSLMYSRNGNKVDVSGVLGVTTSGGDFYIEISTPINSTFSNGKIDGGGNGTAFLSASQILYASVLGSDTAGTAQNKCHIIGYTALTTGTFLLSISFSYYIN